HLSLVVVGRVHGPWGAVDAGLPVAGGVLGRLVGRLHGRAEGPHAHTTHGTHSLLGCGAPDQNPAIRAPSAHVDSASFLIRLPRGIQAAGGDKDARSNGAGEGARPLSPPEAPVTWPSRDGSRLSA
ncbi:unnamed protein product, partial [Ixodes persulcatus]